MIWEFRCSYGSLCYYRQLKHWANDSTISFVLKNTSLEPFLKHCKAAPTGLTKRLYLASRYATVLGNNMHVYLSLHALQLKPVSVKMRLTSVTNVFFWTQLLLEAGKKKKRSCTASLKRLVGIKLEGLEIEWTNRALSCYLWLNRAPAGCSPQQNAALECMKGAQTAAHPPSGFDLYTRDGASHPNWVLAGSAAHTPARDGSRGREDLPAALGSLTSSFALQSLWCHWHQMKLAAANDRSLSRNQAGPETRPRGQGRASPGTACSAVWPFRWRDGRGSPLKWLTVFSWENKPCKWSQLIKLGRLRSESSLFECSQSSSQHLEMKLRWFVFTVEC